MNSFIPSLQVPCLKISLSNSLFIEYYKSNIKKTFLILVKWKGMHLLTSFFCYLDRNVPSALALLLYIHCFCPSCPIWKWAVCLLIFFPNFPLLPSISFSQPSAAWCWVWLRALCTDQPGRGHADQAEQATLESMLRTPWRKHWSKSLSPTWQPVFMRTWICEGAQRYGGLP